MEISVAIDECNPAPGSYLQGTFTVRLPLKYDDSNNPAKSVINQSNDSVALYSDDDLKLAVHRYQARVEEIVKKISNVSTSNLPISTPRRPSILSPSNFQFGSPSPANHYRSINPTFDQSFPQSINQSVQQSINQLIDQTIHRNQLVDSLHVQVLGKILIDKRKVHTKPFQIFRPNNQSINQSNNRAVVDDSSFIVFDSPRVRITAKQLVQDYTQVINQSINQSNDLFASSPSHKSSKQNNQTADPTLLTYDFSCWLPASLPPSFSNQSIKLVYYVSITAFGQSINQSNKQVDPSVLGEIRLPFTVKTSPRFFLAYRDQSLNQSSNQLTNQTADQTKAALEGTVATRINYALLLNDTDQPTIQSVAPSVSRSTNQSAQTSGRPSLNVPVNHFNSIHPPVPVSENSTLTLDLSSINQSINETIKVDELSAPSRLIFTPASITRSLTQVLDHQFDCLIVPDQHNQPNHSTDQSVKQTDSASNGESINQSNNPTGNQMVGSCNDVDLLDDQSINQSIDHDALSLAAWNDACKEIQGMGSINLSDSNPQSINQSINQFIDAYYRPQTFQISDTVVDQTIKQSVPVVKVQLHQSAYRIGDFIQGSFDFSDQSNNQSNNQSISRFPCIRVVCRLVWIQQLDTTINKQSINQSINQTEHGSFHQYTLHSTKSSFSLQIPNNQSINQSNFAIDSLVTGHWELQFKFIVRKPKPSTNGWFWKSSSPSSLSNNQTNNQTIDLNNSVEHCISWSLPLDVWPVTDDSGDVSPASRTMCLCGDAINPAIKQAGKR